MKIFPISGWLISLIFVGSTPTFFNLIFISFSAKQTAILLKFFYFVSRIIFRRRPFLPLRSVLRTFLFATLKPCKFTLSSKVFMFRSLPLRCRPTTLPHLFTEAKRLYLFSRHSFFYLPSRILFILV